MTRAPSAVAGLTGGAHYLFTEEHRLLRESIRAWVRQEISPHIDEWEKEGAFPRSVFTDLGRLGYLGLQYPEEYGGQGGTFVAAMILSEELSYAGAESVSMAVSVHTGMAVPPILKFGTKEQKQRFLPGLLRGELIAALAITEPDAGSDVSGIKTHGRRDEMNGDWVIDGQKTFITNGWRADIVLTVARTDDDHAGRPAFSLFLVDTKTPGFKRIAKLEKIGRHASDTATLSYDSVRVPADALLGEAGRGFHHIMWELDAERTISAASSVALGYHALELATSYISERRQFGRPLASQQAIRHELATLTAQLTAARELVYFVAWKFEHGVVATPEISMAKLVASDVLNRMADYALQLHGGYGYTTDYPISRVWRDARLKRLGAGTDEIQREVIARHLLGRVESATAH